MPGKNEGGEQLINMCVNNRLMIGNTWFKKRRIHKWTWRSRINGECALLDYILVDVECKERLKDVNVLRGIVGGITDHFLVEARLKLRRGFRRGMQMRRKEVINVYKLGEEEYKSNFIREINDEWERVRREPEGGVEEEWSKFKECMLNKARNICGVRVIGKKGRENKRSVWWCDEVSTLLKRKRECYGRWLNGKEGEDWLVFKRVCKVVKAKVKELKRKTEDEWGAKVARDFGTNKKMFWKEINEERKGRVQMKKSVKDKEGQLVNGEGEIRDRWREYFRE